MCAEGGVEEQAGAVRELKEGKGLGNEDAAVKVSGTGSCPWVTPPYNNGQGRSCC